MNPEYLFIEKSSELNKITGLLEKEKILAFDMEADSLYHFKEKVCLLQAATQKASFVIDPLQMKALEPLKNIFSNPEITKIFHGADYDVRSLFRDFGFNIKNLFDTQIASMFLGLEGTGLDAVLQHKFKVHLNKKYQKKDWSIRPLPEEMIKYAARDVSYLIPLAELLQKDLKAKGRLYWVKEECELLSMVRPAPQNNDPIFLKFKGAGWLKKRNLAVLEELLQVRKKIAKKKDKPLFKVFSNMSIMEIAKKPPDSVKGLEALDVLSKKQISMHAKDLVTAVKRALQTPTANLPEYPAKKKSPCCICERPRKN
jgi:ribonuclease D